LGADIVIHSATKYLDGQGRCVGGAIVGGRELLDAEIYPFLRTGEPGPIAAGERFSGRPLRGHAEVFEALRRWKDSRYD
jgi:O-succinylhomoserine sulfhydrylase